MRSQQKKRSQLKITINKRETPRVSFDFKSLSKTRLQLEKQGAFQFKTSSVSISDNAHKILRATTLPVWPMGTHYWVRDNAIIADRLINIRLESEKHSQKYRPLGKKLLFAALAVMSTPSQLQRFKDVIRSSALEFINSAATWPQIFLSIGDNLHGEKSEGWAHKQDAWQILAYYVLKHLEQGTIAIEEVGAAEREFLSLLPPFLAKVRFYRQENSGSWEELEAVRTSVIAWDFALLHQIYRLSAAQRFSFLEAGFSQYRGYLSGYAATGIFHEFLIDLLQRGAEYLYSAIPFECPIYNESDPRYRKADSALIYLLQLNTAHTVAETLNLPTSWVKEAEQKILKTISSLYDPRTGGHKRYENDSYQRVGYFRPEITKKLSEMYGSPSGDASSGFVQRDQIVPKGPEASWTHFTWQLSAWAGKRYQETMDKKYLDLQKKYFKEGMRTITRANEHSIKQLPNGNVSSFVIKSSRFPECYLTDYDAKGREYTFPSPHTPLNWATAEALSAFSTLYRSLQIS